MSEKRYARKDDARTVRSETREERMRRREIERELKNDEIKREKLAAARTAEEKGAKVGRFFRSWTNTAQVDHVFLILVVVLLALGLVTMFSASYTNAYYRHDGNPFWYIKRQAIFACVGLVIMFIASIFNYKKFNSGIAVSLYGISLILLCLALIVNRGKSSDFMRWLSIGPITFQPSDVAKFTLILFLAYNIARQYGMINSKNVLNNGLLIGFDNHITSKARKFYRNASTMSLALTLWYTALISIVCLLVLKENHLSGTILIFTIGVGMMWLGGVKKGYFVLLAVILVGAITLVILKPNLLLDDYAAARIVSWLNKDADLQGDRWQTNQSLMAIASGGPFGLGLGASRQKHMFVSEPQNDFVFAIYCEEFGFIGAIGLIILFAALVYRGFKIGMKADDVFGSMLAMGISLHIGIQVLLNIAVVTDALPNTGISLPFFSYGGTSLLMLLGEMGIVLSVSRRSRIEKG